MIKRFLNKSGEYDYDLKNDIFLFKVKDREYSHSIELLNLVIDFDEEDFIVGLQIFDASKVFKMSKENLSRVKNFKMEARIDEGVIKIDLSFMSMFRNNQITHNPIIFERVSENIPNSEISCTA